MKITDISIDANKIPLLTPFKTALRETNCVEEWVVTVHTDTHYSAQGAAVAVTAVTGETLASIKSTILDIIKPAIKGMSVHSHGEILRTIASCTPKNPSAKAAVDMAIYNLVATYLDMPLHGFLGGKKRELNSDITISLNDPQTMIEHSMNAVKRGFSLLKIKVGSGGKEDLDKIYGVAHAVGNGVGLRIDANQAWQPEEAIHIISQLEAAQLNIDLIEQPVKAHDLQGLKQVKDAVATPILADESLFDAKDAVNILSMGAADLLSIKLLKAGGIYPALQIISIAEVFQVECMLSCMLEGPIGIEAARQLAYAYPQTITRIDLDAPYLYSF